MGTARGLGRYFGIIVFTIVLLSMHGCVYDDHLLKEGKQYAAQGEWDKSVQSFQEAHNQNPSDKEIRLLLYRSKREASRLHLTSGEIYLKKNQFDHAIKEFQTAIAFDPSNIRAESLIEQAKAWKESDHYQKKGENLFKSGKYTQARESFQKALELNPSNEKASFALSHYQKKEERPPLYRLKMDRKTPVSLKFKNTPILNVFEVLTRLTGVNFIFDKDVQETKVTIFITDVSFDEFLDIFLRTNKLAAQVVNEKTLVIYPDNPQKAGEYQNLQIRTFYLAHLDVKQAVGLLSKILKSKDLIANEKLNAVVIRGPRELIEVASKIIEANDRPSSEVTLSVEILEVTRTKEQTLGLEIDPAAVSIQLGEPAFDFYNSDSTSAGFRAAGAGSLYSLDRVAPENILFSLPTATLNLLKQDGDTKTLANPQIRVKNTEKAKIHIGERVPLRTNRRVDTTGAVTTDFQYQDVGVKLDVQPVINVHDEITLDLTLEVSTLGDNVGTQADPQYSIRTRTAKSVLSVRPGETVIIGGLINDEERRTIRKIPLLGDIPAVGYLFSSRATDDTQTDIIMAITPVIARSQEIPDPGIAEIWSGREKDFSLREPFESYIDRSETYSDLPVEEFTLEPEESRTEERPQGMETKPPEAPAPVPVEEEEPLPPVSLNPAPEPPRPRPETSSTKTGIQTASNNPPGKPQEVTSNPQGVPGNCSAPIADSDEDAMPFSWPPAMPYSVHVYSFIHKADAEKQMQRLQENEYPSFTISGYVPEKDRIYHRVFVGQFKDFTSARIYCESLRQTQGFRRDIHVVKRDWAIGG